MPVIEPVGSDGHIEQNDRGEYLRRISVAVLDQDTVQPTRGDYGSLLDADSDTGWYWLPSIIDYCSIDAARVAWSLVNSPLVEMVAEDNDAGTDHPDSPAWVIDSSHHLAGNAPTLDG